MSHITMNRQAGWQQVALFEVCDSEKAAVEKFARGFAHDTDLRIRPMAQAPQGYAWYQGEVDFAYGERRAIYLASNLIQALESAALQGYRLIGGREWITLAMAQIALEKSAGPAR
jgi:hypothetical protein